MSAVYGIGNPLIDVVFAATDDDLNALGLDKGIMHLVSQDRQSAILDYFSGQTPQYRPGGAAPNTLLALAGLGIQAVISGKIGNDDFGMTYDAQVAAYGITSRLVRGDGATGSSIILVTQDGERTMNTHLGMCQEFGIEDLDESLLSKTVHENGFLYFTGYMWDTEPQKGAIRRAIEVTHQVGGRVVFDLADPFAVERYRADFLDLLRHEVDVVFANRREAEILLGIDGTGDRSSADVLARRIAENVPLVALKTGKDGSIIASGPKDFENESISLEYIPARPITPRDTTGAGDMYAAGFLAGLVRGETARRCGEVAGYLAEEIIQQVGAQFEVDVIRDIGPRLFAEP